MSLAKRLEAIRVSFASKVPEEIKSVMSRATQDLRDSGILDGVVGPGSAAPNFSLVASNGETVTLESLRAKGPVVLSFFRGNW